MLENYYEETDFDKEIENYPKEKLIDIVENGADIELMEAAFLKLSFIDEEYALTKGMDFLRNDEFDTYFQACIIDFIYDIDNEKVLDSILNRITDVDFYLFKEILGRMITCTTYEALMKMKNYKLYLNYLFEQYNKYSVDEKIEIQDLLKEFIQKFHLESLWMK
jgi:hypothetical protein